MTPIELTLEIRVTVDADNRGTVFLGDEPMAHFLYSRTARSMEFIEPELPADLVITLETALAAATES